MTPPKLPADEDKALEAIAELYGCLDISGVIVCGTTEPHHRYPWMGRPVTQEEIGAVPDGYDLRECRVCHRRFRTRCNHPDAR